MENNYELDKITIVSNVMCAHLGVDSKELNKTLKKKENKYLYLLLLKNYKCLNKERLKDILDIINEKSISININKAEEKFLVNKNFRETYVEIEKGLNKII
ncbi:hypothetical protein [Clostridium sp.]|uniref:hypothetical protein n=1 Tax=Clostridium sp. TaxID=1506 RepID=UPI002615DF05|nr:hypothetical protein [Clostridium sp.]